MARCELGAGRYEELGTRAATEGVGEGLKFEVVNAADDNMARCELGAGRYEELGTRSARICGHDVSFCFCNKQPTYTPCYTVQCSYKIQV